MKITVKKRYICPASEVFEMGGNDVLLAGSLLDTSGNAGNNEGGGGNQTPGQGDMDDYEEGSSAPGFYDAFQVEW